MVSPIDIIPEYMIKHPLALLDDTGVLLFIAKRGFDCKYISRETVIMHWPGEVSFLDSIEEWYSAVKNVLGENLIEMIFDYHKKKTQKSPA